jgi:hypothetical protein
MRTLERHKNVTARRLFGGLLVASVPLLSACDSLGLSAGRIPTSLEITPGELLLAEGGLADLTVTVLDEEGVAFDVIPGWAIDWSYTNENTVEISGSEVRAIGSGEVFADADVAGMIDRIRLRVNPSEVQLTVPAFHLTQAVQTMDASVPIIAGRPALLRVFVTGDVTSFFDPRVRATFFQSGLEVHTVLMELESDATPSVVDQGILDRSYNAVIPETVIQTGVEIVIEVDPDGLVPLAAGSQARIPATGRLDLGVVEAPPMTLTIVPVLYDLAPNPQVFSWTDGMTSQSDQVRFARTVLPISDFDVLVHDTYTTTSNLTTAAGWSSFLREIRALHAIEGDIGYYYGAVTLPSGSAWGGLGYLGLPTSVGRPNDRTLAHEIGHNMNLRHAPCGGAGGPDPAFPHEGGGIGWWGYDFLGGFGLGGLVDPEQFKDLMGYCNPDWVSDYHFDKALTHRLLTESPGAPEAPAPRQEVLLLWGAAGSVEMLVEPAFVVDAPVKLPSEPGPYRIEGLDTNGARLFDLSFSPDPVEFGGAHFVFAIPYDPSWDSALEEIRLSGPEGEATMDSGGERPPMALVQDPSDGSVRAIVRDPGSLDGVDTGMDILLSDGLRTRPMRNDR